MGGGSMCSRHNCKTIWMVTIGAFIALLWCQYFQRGKLCQSKVDLTGKTVVVTGANNGIGYETALSLARLNAKVIIACRNMLKADKAVENIKQTAGTNSVEYLIVDFAEMKDIRRAAEELLLREERLDILINNAAVVSGGRTRDGLDIQFGVNHIGYFMFTNLLMPLMRETSKKSPVRIVNVSSGVYSSGVIDFKNLNPHIPLNASISDFLKQYANTKLMNVYFTRELNDRLKLEFKGQNQAITTYALHPGSIKTNIGKDLSDHRGVGSQLIRYMFMVLVAIPSEYGGQQSLCCAVEEGIEKYSGYFFSNFKPLKYEKNALSRRVGSMLWSVSENITGVHWKA